VGIWEGKGMVNEENSVDLGNREQEIDGSIDSLLDHVRKFPEFVHKDLVGGFFRNWIRDEGIDVKYLIEKVNDRVRERIYDLNEANSDNNTASKWITKFLLPVERLYVSEDEEAIRGLDDLAWRGNWDEKCGIILLVQGLPAKGFDADNLLKVKRVAEDAGIPIPKEYITYLVLAGIEKARRELPDEISEARQRVLDLFDKNEFNGDVRHSAHFVLGPPGRMLAKFKKFSEFSGSDRPKQSFYRFRNGLRGVAMQYSDKFKEFLKRARITKVRDFAELENRDCVRGRFIDGKEKVYGKMQYRHRPEEICKVELCISRKVGSIVGQHVTFSSFEDLTKYEVEKIVPGEGIGRGGK